MRADVYVKRAKGRRRERGVALIMVLLSVVTLTVFLTDLQQESSGTFAAAVAARDRVRAEYNAKSAVNLSRLLIAIEPTVRNAVKSSILGALLKGRLPQIPVWEFANDVLGAYNCPDNAEGFTSLTGVDVAAGENLGLGEGAGCFDLVIVDEDSKINANAAARSNAVSSLRLATQLLGAIGGTQHDPLFQEVDADGQHTDRTTLCAALIDWADGDEKLENCDITGTAAPSGVEDNYYQTLGLDYFRKNAAFDSLEELRLVRGVSDEFWATFVDPDPTDPKARVMTVWGQGEKINVNTANAQTLLAVVCANAPDAALCLDPVQMAMFMQIVDIVRNMTAGAPVFGSANDFINTMQGQGLIGPFLVQMGIQPVQFKSPAEVRKIVDTKSKVFSIYAEGVVPAQGRETRTSVHAVIDYRAAIDLQNMPTPSQPGQPASPGGTPRPGSGVLPGTGNDVNDAALELLATDPMGRVIHWRVR
jgi:general secretion pathway protein K